MTALAFDAETHTYRLDGREVPSVTQVLRPLYAQDARWWSDADREHGTAVHKATEAIDRDEAPSYPDEAESYVKAYALFLEELAWKPTHIEHQVSNRDYGYAGTVDRVFLTPKGPVIVDIKTSAKVIPWTALQLAGYALAFGSALPVAYALQLKRDGTYRLHPYDTDQARQPWLAALALYKWRRANGC
jgi:hypothetical protein